MHEMTNANVMTTDGAATDRQAYLRSLHRMPLRRLKPHAMNLGVPAPQIWMTDVSGSDRRSVKAQLAGRGDYRALWWFLCESLHKTLNPRRSLVARMTAFHGFHHRATLLRLRANEHFTTVCMAVGRYGPIRGVLEAERQLAATRKLYE